MTATVQQIAEVIEQLTVEERQTVLQFAQSLVQRKRGGIDARTAQRRVSTWLVSEVGNLLMGGEPEYIAGEHPMWRVPVMVTKGRVGQATSVDVDATSGQLVVGAHTPSRIIDHVRAFVARSPLS